MKRLTSCNRSTIHRSLLNTTCLNIDDLPETLLVEILCRLPCKFVILCKCVSKSWSTLISDPYFDSRRALYLRNNDYDNEQVLMFVNYSSTSGDLIKAELFTICKQDSKVKPLECFSNLFCSYQAVATYNDLILLYNNQENNYCIYNPFTKQWVALPKAPPCGKDVHVGFTCDSDNRCCKVVRVLGFKRELETPPFEVEVFSTETGIWRKLDLVLQGFKPRLGYFTDIHQLQLQLLTMEHLKIQDRT